MKEIYVMNNKKYLKIKYEEYERYKKENPEDVLLARTNHQEYNYQAVIECIARQEERYLKEWIEYHLGLGFDRIFIYDNNDEEGLEEFLRKEISEENYQKIEIILWQEKMSMQQIEAVNDFIDKHGEEVKWMISLDIDEFITLEKPLKEFLDEYKEASQIYLNWESISADNQIYYENKKVQERFFKRFSCKDLGQGKCFVRPFKIKSFGIHASILTSGKTVNVLHQEIKAPDSFATLYERGWIKHYFTKSLEEWEWKIERGCADNLYCRRYELFFEINPTLKKYYNPKFQKIQRHSHALDNEIIMK